MQQPRARTRVPVLVLIAALAGLPGLAPEGGSSEAMKETMTKVENELAARYGEAERPRIQRGIEQAARFWRPEDGDAKAFAEMVRTHVAVDSVARNALFSRMEFALESLDGHMNEITRDFRWQSDLDLGRDLPLRRDPRGLRPVGARQRRLLQEPAGLRGAPQLPADDARSSGSQEGPAWTRRQWAEARLAERFSKRVPADGQPGRSARPAPRPTATSPSTTSGCTTSSTRRDSASSRRSCACSRTGTCATRSRPTTPTRRPAWRKQRHDRAGHGAHRHADDPGGRHRQPATSTGTRSRTTVKRAASQRRPDRRRRRRRREADQRRRARHALRDASEDVSGRAQGGPVLADRADADRPPLRREPRRSPRRACARCSRRCSPRRSCPQVAARHREAPRPPARAVRRLVQRLPRRAASTPRTSSTRSSRKTLPDGRGLPGRHPQPPRQARLHRRSARDYLGRPHRRRSGARLGPRHRAPRGAATRRTCARASRRTG